MKTETKHTPGPWRNEPSNAYVADGGWHVYSLGRAGAYNRLVAELRPSTVAEADARLIAAAPDLLEALKYARGIVAAQLGENSGHVVPLDAAIAKATEAK